MKVYLKRNERVKIALSLGRSWVVQILHFCKTFICYEIGLIDFTRYVLHRVIKHVASHFCEDITYYTIIIVNIELDNYI